MAPPPTLLRVRTELAPRPGYETVAPDTPGVVANPVHDRAARRVDYDDLDARVWDSVEL